MSLPKLSLKSAKAVQDSESSYKAPTIDGVSDFYTDAKCTEKVSTWSENTVGYYIVELTEDLGSADVAIYSK